MTHRRASPQPGCYRSGDAARATGERRRFARRLLGRAALGLILSSALRPAAGTAQNAGSILGRVIDATTGESADGALLAVENTSLRTLSAPDGRFIIVAVPPGERSVSVELIGYASIMIEGVLVRAGQPTRLDVELSPQALELPGVVAEVERVRLVEPEISATHEVVLASELRELPMDEVAEAVELAPGVSDGHFRGGRIGQETYVVDGLEFKNQFEASTQGPALQHPPPTRWRRSRSSRVG